jgi:asparagine synthase (glutamine-hydrolysing)
MSIIFGIRRGQDQRVEEQSLIDLARLTARFALDGVSIRSLGQIGMGAQLVHTTLRSHFGAQPMVDDHGNMVVFDGRIDNDKELAVRLGLLTEEASDSEIVLASFLRWGEECFQQLTGDWALALWCGADKSIYLARDHAGTRTLFYEHRGETLKWSTYLETFFVPEEMHSFDEQYAAAFLSLAPIRDLTPYAGILAVPPAHYLVLRDKKILVKSHWNPAVKSSVRYNSDGDYEEHFFALFEDSVGRRTVAGTSLLSQLSGGMDSSSIVCMSDFIRRSADPGSELLDTVSFYDDSEPDWNERPYFSSIEAGRRKAGIHVDVALRPKSPEPDSLPEQLGLLPGLDWFSYDIERRLNKLVRDKGYRVMLSGIGGDELTGGVPTPLPELSDYLIGLRFGRLLQGAARWSLSTRRPIAATLVDTARFSLGLYCPICHPQNDVPPWIAPKLRKSLRDRSDPARVRTGSKKHLPSAISNGQVWWAMLETLPGSFPASLARYEYRYPFLDKDLVDFLLRIPREQLVRPGRRRSLMRRALKTIVPTEILERKRKAFLIRRPLAYLQQVYQEHPSLCTVSHSAQSGYIDPKKFHQTLEAAVNGAELRWSRALMRTIIFELWLSSDPLRVASRSDIPQPTLLQATERPRSVRAS